jgi:hypothetical protein
MTASKIESAEAAAAQGGGAEPGRIGSDAITLAAYI